MTNKTVRELIRFACECNGCPEVTNLIWFEWSNRMTVTMGTARGGPEIGYRIKLAARVFAIISEEEQRDTVIHETCHIIDGYTNKRAMSHGEGWKDAMRRAGLEPRRIYEAGDNSLVKRFIYSCPNKCRDTYRLSTVIHNRINRGRLRICAKCNSQLSFTGQVEGGR
jgi:predicted SprT family Zn-dependent metalloprotease